MVQLSEKQKYEIIIRIEQGQSTRYIASDMNINRKAITRWNNRYTKTGSINRLRGSGRKRKTTHEEDLIVLNNIPTFNKVITIDDIKNNLIKDNINLSNTSIINRLKENDYIYRNPIKKPLLTTKHKQLRLWWALTYYNFNWEKVRFSDESIIKKKFNTKQWMHKDNIKIERVVSHPISILLWGFFDYNKIGQLYCFNGIMDAKVYISILENNLLPFKDNSYSFQFDNDPKHTATQSIEFLFNNDIKCLLWWPPNSPDLNPIENIWAYIKHKLRKETISNVIELETKIKLIWSQIDITFIHNLINSMKKRIDSVIENNGDYIDY
jgi:transposase